MMYVKSVFINGFFSAGVCLALTIVPAFLNGAYADPIDIASRLEPMMDDHLIDDLSGLELRLHNPVPREAVITFDEPWEGNTSGYYTVFRDNRKFRMYYRGSHFDLETKKGTGQRACYAESRDGIDWQKPELGLFEFEGSKKNNIVWDGPGSHNFSPFKDANPKCAPDARYKALGRDKGGLIAFKSPDGIRWSLIQKEPVITKGAFDSQNIAFWDSVRECYVDFHRGFKDGVRDIMTCTSDDFVNWTEPQWLDYGDIPKEHLYTNAITTYPRAPHILVGFPKRFVPSRDPGLHHHPGVSDGVFMTSRDGLHWHRWREALIRPGLQESRWVNRNNMTAWGILQLPSKIPGTPDELSIYSSEGYYTGPCKLRRFTVRLDGFISVHAPAEPGSVTTKLLTFADDPAVDTQETAKTRLMINYSTSATGTIRCAILDAGGEPIEGYSIDDCDPVYGDHIQREVTWSGNAELAPLAGKPVRLKFVMSDADLYAIQFR